MHAQKVFCRDIGDYHGLYVQCYTLLLADAFEKFRDTCTEIYGLDPSHFWQTYLKKKKSKFRIINRHWYVINDWSRN